MLCSKLVEEDISSSLIANRDDAKYPRFVGMKCTRLLPLYSLLGIYNDSVDKGEKVTRYLQA